MMTISDIIEIIVVCALIFFPLGYLARHSLRRIRDTLRLFFAKPRYVKPAGTLRRTEKARGNQKNDSIYTKYRHAFFPLAILARPFRLELLFSG
ncbi:cellulose biosynthesis protein BcsF [Escherichia coli]|nr:cellulose biosynthesis protein BcsF [Escherichia coli]